jgi:hypothetical protein
LNYQSLRPYLSFKQKRFEKFGTWSFQNFRGRIPNLNHCDDEAAWIELNYLLGLSQTNVSVQDNHGFQPKVLFNLIIRYLLRFFDCLAHPNLCATFATDQN